MNAQRRKAIKALYKDIEALRPLLEKSKELTDVAETLKDQIEAIKDEEQDYIDNLPENLQQSEKAETANQAVSDLEEAAGLLEQLIISEIFDVDDLIGKLDEVAGGG